MAEIHFYQTEQENFETIDFLINKYKVRFVPEKNQEKDYCELATLGDIKRHLEDYEYAPRYFILSNEWSQFPLFQSKLVKDVDFLYYYIMQRHGGPAFDFIFSRTYMRNDKKWIIAGSISDYPWYYEDDDIQKEFPRPERMKEAFTEISRYLKKGSKKSICKEKGFPGPIIRKEALSKFEEGTWLRAGDLHFIPKGN
jgi:hypothetical protein